MATGLRFKWGGYESAIGTARPVSMTITQKDVNSYQPTLQYELQCELWLSAEGPAALTTAFEALKAALAIPRVPGGIQYTTDSGGSWFNTSHYVNTSGAYVGPVARSIGAPGGPLQYAIEQYVQIAIMAEYNNSAETQELLRWEETVDITGEGGAKTTLRPRHNAVSLLQELRPYTDVSVTQSGTIVGRSGYQSIPTPLIATTGARQVDVSRDGKRKRMVGGSNFEYIRQYSYQYLLNAHPGAVNPGGL